MKHPKAWRFIDQNNDGSLDEEAQDFLEVLKNKYIPERLDKENIFHFKIKWSDNEGVNEEDHQDYLKEFCNTFEREILRQVEHAVKTSTNVSGDPLYEEILEHAHQGLAKCERFHGRTDILDKIQTYITSYNTKPLTIYGESGCGKTSLMAKAALMVNEHYFISNFIQVVISVIVQLVLCRNI